MRKLVIIFVGLLPVCVAAQTSLDTLRHLDIKPGGGYSALWGYTGPDGREYALLGCNGSGGQQAGTSIIDITDTGNVHQAAFIPGPASLWREMKTYQHYAYIVSEAGGGTQIVDLSGLPDSARLVRAFTYTGASGNTSRSHSITISDGFMYLNGCASWSPGGIVIFDLRTDPTNPQFVGTYEPEYIHDCYVLRDTIYGSAIYSGGGLHIADARNKSNIHEIGKITYVGSGTHNSWVTKDRHYAITTDEIGSINPHQLHFWDISNLPTIPTSAIAAFTPSPVDIVHNVTVRGDYAYVAWYTLGAVVVNISNPANPTYAGGFDTSTIPPPNYDGVWGIYPYFPSGKIVAGDMQNGLWVFRFTDLAPRVPVILLQPAMGETTAVHRPIPFNWTKAANMTKDPHWYEVHMVGPGLDTTWRADDSVTVFSSYGLLQTGGVYSWSVTTRDEFNSTQSPDTFQFHYGSSTTSVKANNVPTTFALLQNYPNPFNPSTLIRYQVPVASHVSLRLYNLLGQEVKELVNNTQGPGKYSVTLDAGTLPSGIYFYALTAGSFKETKKLVLLR